VPTAGESFWTDERIEQLRNMVQLDQMTRKEMAAELGTTKSAVCAKIARLGLAMSMTEKLARDAIRNKSKPKRTRREREVAQKTENLTDRFTRVFKQPTDTWQANITPHCEWVEESTDTQACWECFDSYRQCHWPIRDTPFMFCGAPRVWDTYTDKPASPYCARHADRAKRKMKEDQQP
jgi:hypothetical protein